MTPSKSETEITAQQEQAKHSDQADANYSTVSENNKQLNGAVQDTPYYENEVKSGTAATTAGYDASARNVKSQMEAAGVSGRSGVAAGNETALGAQEASALAQVKTNAYADTEKQQLAANAQDLTAAGQQLGASTANLGVANEDEENRQKTGNENKKALAQAVAMAAAGL